MHKLYIFDADGTLVEPWSIELLPGVEDWFRSIGALDSINRPAIAIASNQGGVGCRYWMETGNWGDPEQFPTEEQADTMYRDLGTSLGRLARTGIAVYTAFAYQSKKGNWGPTPPNTRYINSWSQDWRKPSSGMLLQAMTLFSGWISSPRDVLMVGDSEEDRLAAKAAGTEFMLADEFFVRTGKVTHEAV